jgi:hypothetical protein
MWMVRKLLLMPLLQRMMKFSMTVAAMAARAAEAAAVQAAAVAQVAAAARGMTAAKAAAVARVAAMVTAGMLQVPARVGTAAAAVKSRERVTLQMMGRKTQMEKSMMRVMQTTRQLLEATLAAVVTQAAVAATPAPAAAAVMNLKRVRVRQPTVPLTAARRSSPLSSARPLASSSSSSGRQMGPVVPARPQTV